MTVSQDKDLAAYLKEARSFDYDSRLAAERSKRTAWIIAGAASIMALTRLKIAVLAPMPSASVRIAASAKRGDLRRLRSAKRVSWAFMATKVWPSVSLNTASGVACLRSGVLVSCDASTYPAS